MICPLPPIWKVVKGQIKPKADLHAVDSPTKSTKWINYFFFAVNSKKATKTNSFVRFLGESAARQSACGFNWSAKIWRGRLPPYPRFPTALIKLAENFSTSFRPGPIEIYVKISCLENCILTKIRHWWSILRLVQFSGICQSDLKLKLV